MAKTYQHLLTNFLVSKARPGGELAGKRAIDGGLRCSGELF